MVQWRAIRLDPAETSKLGSLWSHAEIEVCQLPNELWLRCTQPATDEETSYDFKRLPGTRFDVLAEGQLVPIGNRVPIGYLPKGPWVRLQDWMQLAIEPAAFSGLPASQIRLRLVRGGVPTDSNVLLTSLKRWEKYVLGAPDIRFSQLAFGMNYQEQVIVRGTPLPPLQGDRFVESFEIAIPTGWTWNFAMDSERIRTVLPLEQGDLALFRVDGSWDHIRSHAFVQTTRAAIRESVESVKNG